MKLKTEEVKEKLGILYKHLSKNKNLGETALSFIFDNNRILVVNDRYSFEIPFEIGVRAVVLADETTKIINGLNDPEVILKKKDDFLMIKAQGVKAQIACFDVDEEMLEAIEPKSKWKKVPEGFNKGIKLTSFSVSRDISDLVFNCVYINKSTIVGTDNFRIGRYEMKEDMKEFLLPLNSAILLSSHVSKKYALDENFIHFKNKDGSVFHSGIVSGEFPDTSELFEVKGSSFNLPSELQKTINLVSVLAEGEYLLDKKVKINVEKGIMKCKAENETGWIESEIKLDSKKDVSFLVNPVFMSEMLKLSSSAVIGKDKIVFKAEDFDHLIMIFSEDK